MGTRKSAHKKAKIKKVVKKKPTRKPKAAAPKPWSDATFAGFGVPPQGGWGPD